MDKWKVSIYFLYSFKTVWPWITFNLSWATYQEVSWYQSEYQHQDSDIANTQFMWLLLYHGSWTNGRDTSIFILFLNSLTMNYTTSNLATYLQVVLGRTQYHHQDGDIPNPGIMLVVLYHGSWTNGRDPYICCTLSRQFDHELHCFNIGITHKRH
jgi:hypothetical protein